MYGSGTGFLSFYVFTGDIEHPLKVFLATPLILALALLFLPLLLDVAHMSQVNKLDIIAFLVFGCRKMNGWVFWIAN